jgi:hypothetical protein
MTDTEFVAAFESCALPNAAFRHRDHLRLAWIYLRRAPYAEAVRMMQSSIRKFAAHHAAADKYHHTITVLWMRLVAAAAADDDHATFDGFIGAHGHLLDKHVVKNFYSDHLLSSASARTGWIDPDLRPLPDVCGSHERRR